MMGLFIWLCFWNVFPFISPTIMGPKIVVVPSEEVVALGVKVWANYLVGHIIDAKKTYVVI